MCITIPEWLVPKEPAWKREDCTYMKENRRLKTKIDNLMKSESKRLNEERLDELPKRLMPKEPACRGEDCTHMEENRRLKTKIDNLKSELKRLNEERLEESPKLGCVSVQNDNFVDEKKKDEIFSETDARPEEFSHRNGQKRNTEMTYYDPSTNMPVQETRGKIKNAVEELCFTEANLSAKHHPKMVNNGTASNGGGQSRETESNKDQSTNTVNDKTMSSNTLNQPSTSRHNPCLQGDIGCNGNKLSKHQKPTADCGDQHSKDGQVNADKWLCRHYKRRCFVMFSCCKKYWPCHRCHNNESKCGQKRLKSRDTKTIKCANCETEQQFGKKSQSCTKCHETFAEFFCAKCKHLTGMDDKPYHCQKCGICRIHSDRSFHCDVCGVCLDVQLRDNHICRAGSAHDECCICLEDAFSGCQILPCSHKVHKECATQMIRSGITCCPICRASFAHKLEKQSQPSSKKQHGKK